MVRSSMSVVELDASSALLIRGAIHHTNVGALPACHNRAASAHTIRSTDEATPMTARRNLPPTWILGLTNATFGMMGGFVVLTLPEILAAQGMPAGRIARITSLLLLPGFFVVLGAPVLDVRFSRRTYALVTAALSALGLIATVLHRNETALVVPVMFVAYTATCVYQNAVGGWMGALIPREEDSRLGAWFAIANTGAGGIMMVSAGELLHGLRPPLAATVLAAMVLSPTLLFPFIPAPPPDRRLASESFRQFFGELVALIQRREVLVALVLFVLPSASFALTNVLGGVGKDFHASERLVSLSAGIGSVVAAILGSLLVLPLARRWALRPLYLAIGVAGGLFTLSLLLLPHSPAVFAIAIIGENLFQAMSFAAGNAITFEVIGPGNPLAATTFSILLAAVNLAIDYMTLLDGKGYDHGGVAGSFLLDADLSIVVCLALAWPLVLASRAAKPQPSDGILSK